MKVHLVRVPAFMKRFEEDVGAYVRQLARVIQENYDNTQNAINNNDANAAAKTRVWMQRNT